MAYKSNASVAAGSSITQDVAVQGGTYLAVTAVAGPTAGAASDVSITVLPYDDNPAVAGPALTQISAPLAAAQPANTLVANLAYATAIYLVAGYDKVQVQAKNNNAGALPVAVTYGFRSA